MTKLEIIDALLEKTDLKSVEIDKFLEALKTIIRDALMKGEKVSLTGLGTFTVRTRKARLARNPLTGVQVQVPARRVVMFKVGKTLKGMLPRPTKD